MSTESASRTTGRRRRVLFAAAAVGVIIAVVAALIAAGVIWPNRVAAAGYETRGVDVSVYQGDIDWTVLGSEDIDFAIIKSTEGSGSQDSQFAANWAGARDTDLVVGAYHFMSFESAGETQAENVINTVPAEPGTLPVTVDLEYYGDFHDNPPTRSHVKSILDPLLADLEEHYGMPPIIYATQKAYDRYLLDAYPDNPIWIRSIAKEPTLPDDRDWTFWQYSDRDRLPGYDGEEEFIDMNVFDGTVDDLRALTR
ncbi:GH25 family lysozyme [Mycetocola zhujimingii]|uniref:Lysozyme n=1 Tax=Mycetocola zhujimingii TaxID=2079792 RepID=A0A2U1TCG4_9MICO|nr:GH25 family lysozyme [Mycetocola zhujimingii]PWC06587.1 lysozyme [Mycetocola zhujimingii]